MIRFLLALLAVAVWAPSVFGEQWTKEEIKKARMAAENCTIQSGFKFMCSAPLKDVTVAEHIAEDPFAADLETVLKWNGLSSGSIIKAGTAIKTGLMSPRSEEGAGEAPVPSASALRAPPEQTNPVPPKEKPSIFESLKSLFD